VHGGRGVGRASLGIKYAAEAHRTCRPAEELPLPLDRIPGFQVGLAAARALALLSYEIMVQMRGPDDSWCSGVRGRADPTSLHVMSAFSSSQ
jgi:hypothetical protein